MSISAANGPARRFSLAVTRTVSAVPADLLTAPKPARIDVAFPDGATTSAGVMRLPVHNSGSEPIPLGTPVVVRFSTVDGETESPVAVPTLPGVQAASCPVELLPKQDCAIELTIPARLSAGRYAVEVALSGPGGGRASANVRLDVRLSAWWAGLLVALGALAGYFVVLFRERGRTILDRRISLADARERISRLAEGARTEVVRRRAKGLLDSARALEDTIVAGGDPSEGIATLATRGRALAAADEALTRAQAVEPQDLFVPLTDKLTMDLQSDRWTVETLDTAVQRLHSELDALPDLLAAAKALTGALADLAPLDGWPPATTVRPIRQQLINAFTPIPPGDGKDTESVLRGRVTALKTAAAQVDAIAKEALSALLTAVKEEIARNPDKPALKDLEGKLTQALQADRITVATARQLVDEARALGLARPLMQREAAPAESQIPTISTPFGGLDGNPFLLGMGRMIPSAWLRFTRGAWTLATDLVVLIGIGVSGVLVLWVGNTAWGTVTDIATALLAGAGTRLAVGPVTKPGQ